MDFSKLNSADDMIGKLSVTSDKEATKELTRFYARSRFKLDDTQFELSYVDAGNDGGIDFCYEQDKTFFIFQTKFTSKPKDESLKHIMDEIHKIENTIVGNNPNTRAQIFVNNLKRCVEDETATLEIVWLTTYDVPLRHIENVQKNIDVFRKKNGWDIKIDFHVIDKSRLSTVIYDVKHDFIPFTGKQILEIEKDSGITYRDTEMGIDAYIFLVDTNDILKWFNNVDVEKFLQKNVREFLGDKSVNKEISKSYIDEPEWFWYKHNGIVIFADDVVLDSGGCKLSLRNPQIVNGGQTIKTLFNAYDKNGRIGNTAKILVRIYRLPYEDIETYKTSIKIVSALNSQNKINPSDLRSNDPRQVRIQQLMSRLGFKYHRKRSKENKSSSNAIPVRKLALPYYICKNQSPHGGPSGKVDELFEEQNKYDEIFPEKEINKELSSDTSHVVIKYVTIWRINHLIQKTSLPKQDEKFRQYTQFFVLVDLYKKVNEWVRDKFKLGREDWIDFINSEYFGDAISSYALSGFGIATSTLPKNEEARRFFRSPKSTKRYFSKTKNLNFKRKLSSSLKKFKRSKSI